MTTVTHFTVQHSQFTNDADSEIVGTGDSISVVGTVTFAPVDEDHKPIRLSGTVPSGYILRPVTGYLDSDGRLKTQRGGALGVRLPANDPLFNIPAVVYKVTFDVKTPFGKPITLAGGYFRAPSEDTTVQLIDVLTPPRPAITSHLPDTVYADEIADSGIVGRNMLRATTNAQLLGALGLSAGGVGQTLLGASTQKAARLALGPAVFDARDYGVIADGAAHNNVANLLDCFAACAAAGGGTVLLPPGVIDTSEAIALRTLSGSPANNAETRTVLTADSGNTYINHGGIPLPVDVPITVCGHGTSVTTVKLSAGFPRFLDFWYEADGQNYDGICVRDLTVDRNNLLSTSVARQQCSTLTTLAAGAWTTVPGLTATAFRNAPRVVLPVTNAGTSANYRIPCRIVGTAVQLYNPSGSGLTVALNDWVQAFIDHHVILGMRNNTNALQEGFGAGFFGPSMTISNLLVENVDAINIACNPPANYTDGVLRLPTDTSTAISLLITKASSPATITDVTLRNVRIFGGDNGVLIKGTAGGEFIDRVKIYDCFHDTLVNPPRTGLYFGANYQIGGLAYLGHVEIANCVGRRSFDVALELDQPWSAIESNNRWEECPYGFLSNMLAIPARTADGPPKVTGVTLTSGATTASITLPSGVSRDGLMMIDSELIWYQAANTGATSLNLWRGINGTTAASHTSAVAQFVEVEKTRIVSTGSRIRNTLAMQTDYSLAGRGFNSNTSMKIPLTPITIRDAVINLTGGRQNTIGAGRFVAWDGWRMDTVIENCRFMWDSMTESWTPRIGGYGITARSVFNAVDRANSVPIPANRIFTRNLSMKVAGSTVAGTAFSLVQIGEGHHFLDMEFSGELEIAGCDSGSTVFAKLSPDRYSGGPTEKLYVAHGSRMSIIARTPKLLDASPKVLSVPDQTYTIIESTVDVSANLSGLLSSSYAPWSIDNSQAAAVLSNEQIVVDNALTIQNNSDTTKQIQFSASAITTGTTRTFTLPDTSSTLEVTANKDQASGYAGLNASGQVTKDTTGNAATATKLATARTLGPVNLGATGSASFDGSANVTPGVTGSLPQSSVTNLTSDLAGKEPTIAAGTTGQYWRGDKSWQTLDKTAVGLSSVDNTADSAKVVASAAKWTTARNLDGQSVDGTADVAIIAPATNAATSKATPIDADSIPLVDTAASNVLKKLTWANLKTTLASYYDSLTTTMTNKSLTLPKIDGISEPGTSKQVLGLSAAQGANSGTYFQINAAQYVPSIQAVGNRTDIPIYLQPKGNSSVAISTGSGVTPTLKADGSDSNLNLDLVPKGTGTVTVNSVAVSTNSTTATHTAQQIELGHATDTTIARASAGMITVEGNTVPVRVSVPATASSTGVSGQIAFDANFIYCCTATNTWVRAALATW